MKLTGIASRFNSEDLWESLTTPVRAVIAAIFDKARATKLDAKWAVENPEADFLARVATTPKAPDTRAPAPAQRPAPELPNAAPCTKTRIPKTTRTIPEIPKKDKF